MAKILTAFSLNVYEGTNDNVVTLSRSGNNPITSFTVAVFEQLVIPANAIDQLITLPATATKTITIENSGSVDLVVKLNATNGTAFALPKTVGFIAIATTTVVSSLYVTNSDLTTAGTLKAFVGG